MTKKLSEAVASLEAKMHGQKEGEREDMPALPHWRDNVRGIPNAMARSALFKASAKGEERRMVNEEKIFALEGISIYFTGIELSQEDGDVFMQIVHMSRGKESGASLVTTGYELLRSLDWGTSSRDYDRLKASIRRLKAAMVAITCKVGTRKVEFGGAILANYMFSDEDPTMAMLNPDVNTRSVWELTMDSKIANLFARDVYTQINWDQRQELPPLAKWLHAFYHTHANPYTYKVQTLHKLCGSASAEMKSFRQKLKQAMDLLKATGFLESWSYDRATDSITVLRARNISK